MALSTQRSIAAPFQTTTPASASACRTPSRSVVASKVPPERVRRRTPSGKRIVEARQALPEGCVASMATRRAEASATACGAEAPDRPPRGRRAVLA